MPNQKLLIYDLSLLEIKAYIKTLGEPEFRGNQIWNGIYKQYRTSFEEITTLPAKVREKLSDHFTFSALLPQKTIKSKDGQTIKTLFELQDHFLIEAVLMYYDERRTLCISSQSGCSIGCFFCATGQMGFGRNLSSGEIIAQVLYYARHLAGEGDRVTNIVVMGMGEPFLNYQNVLTALDRLNAPDGFGLGARRFTISTVGLVPEIRKFADANLQYNLAISLHTVDDNLRTRLIPINRKYPVDAIINACRYYIKQTNRRVTFEYAMMEGVNDSVDDAENLARKIRGMNCHVNLIPVNPIKGFTVQPSTSEQVKCFFDVLDQHHIPCTIRMRRGIEIQAGCGQLAAGNRDDRH